MSDYLKTTLEDIKTAAAMERTYGDGWALVEAIQEELAWVRPEIAQRQREIRAKSLKAEWARQRDWPETSALYLRQSAAATTDLLLFQAFRDELAEGLRTWKRLDREHHETMKKLLDEVAAQ